MFVGRMSDSQGARSNPRTSCNARSVRLLIVAAVVLVSSFAVADDWPRAHPRGWHGRGFENVVEVFPAKSRNNQSDRPLAYFYTMGYPGIDWKADAKLVWSGPLVNREAPYEAIVSMDGWLVTFDEWGNLGYDNAVVIYDPRGKLVKSWKLDDLLPEDVRDRDRSISSRYWRKGASYAFDAKRKLLRIGFKPTGVLEIGLADGSHTYKPSGTLASASSNDMTEVWEVNLRFSSITDVLAAKAHRP
jgi:hypothetical protein